MQPLELCPDINTLGIWLRTWIAPPTVITRAELPGTLTPIPAHEKAGQITIIHADEKYLRPVDTEVG